MTDNFYINDLILSIRKETTMERYWPLIPYREMLLTVMRENGITFRDEVTDRVMAQICEACGSDMAGLFSRFIHIYDFNRQKLREIRQYEGTEVYGELADLLRLPGVRILRARLYYQSGVTLRTLAERPTDEIQAMVRALIEREHRTEVVPLTKEVNCHREVAGMILHLSDAAK